MDDLDCDTNRPPVPSRLLPLDHLDPCPQLYDVADCDSWNLRCLGVRRSTGPHDPYWKGDYDRDGARTRAIDAGPHRATDSNGSPRPVYEVGTLMGAGFFDFDDRRWFLGGDCGSD